MCEILRMKKIIFGNKRVAFHFGDQKINLHLAEKVLDPRVKYALTGSSDLYFVFQSSLGEIVETLKNHQIKVVAVPSVRAEVCRPIHSAYCYGPDESLIELSSYD